MRGEGKRGLLVSTEGDLLFSLLTTGFAKKTFISYSVTFGDSFRQGKVVGIDPERQQVLLSDGEVGGVITCNE